MECSSLFSGVDKVYELKQLLPSALLPPAVQERGQG